MKRHTRFIKTIFPFQTCSMSISKALSYFWFNTFKITISIKYNILLKISLQTTQIKEAKSERFLQPIRSIRVDPFQTKIPKRQQDCLLRLFARRNNKIAVNCRNDRPCHGSSARFEQVSNELAPIQVETRNRRGEKCTSKPLINAGEEAPFAPFFARFEADNHDNYFEYFSLFIHITFIHI